MTDATCGAGNIQIDLFTMMEINGNTVKEYFIQIRTVLRFASLNHHQYVQMMTNLHEDDIYQPFTLTSAYLLQTVYINMPESP